MYRVCLQRNPEPEGLAHWTNLLRTGQITGAEMASGFYTGAEMKSFNHPNATFITLAYNGIMNRGPDAEGLAHWKKQLDNGVSYQYIVSGFVQSPEFSYLCGLYGIVPGRVGTSEPRDMNAGITGFVYRLYTKVLGRGAEVEGLNHWCTILNAEPVRAKFLDVALNGFLHSVEFLGKNLNDMNYVKVLYRTFLGREAEPEGLKHWLNKLQTGSTRDSIAKEFAYSPEFGIIMAQYGIQ